MKKRKAYPGSLYDLYGVELWLAQQAREGFHLEKFGGFGNLAFFWQGEPQRTRYHLEPDFSQYKTTDEHDDFAQEWNFVCKVPGVFLVYETDDPWAAKPAKWKIKEKYLKKKWRDLWGSFVLWVITIALTGWKLIKDLIPATASYIDWLTMLPAILLSSVLLFLVEFWKGLPSLYDIWIWRRSFLMEEEIERRPVMAVFRWGEQWIFPLAMAAAVITVVAASAGASRNIIPLSRIDHPLPLVTLELTEGQIYYAPEDYGSGVNVSVEKSLLVPEDIMIRSTGMFEKPSEPEAWMELSYGENYHAKMNFHYYQLRREAMAERLAEEEAGGRHSRKVEQDDFDELWLWKKQDGWQYLVAREGDVVITISYIGSGLLAEQLEELYEVVTGYRNQ